MSTSLLVFQLWAVIRRPLLELGSHVLMLVSMVAVFWLTGGRH